MSVLFQFCRKAIGFGGWCLAAAVLVFGLSGCKSWQTPDDGLRHSDLSTTARQARSSTAKPDEQKEPDDPWMSDKAKQISRDLQ
jgi:hypothetical protein